MNEPQINHRRSRLLLPAALAAALLGWAVAPASSAPARAAHDPTECHKWHCHGAEFKTCGGGWKGYRDTIEITGPEGGHADPEQACSALQDKLEADAEARAAAECIKRHPCATCPDECQGCQQRNPRGRIDVASAKKKQLEGGSWECTIKGEVIFRCECGPCIKKNKPKDAWREAHR